MQAPTLSDSIDEQPATFDEDWHEDLENVAALAEWLIESSYYERRTGSSKPAGRGTP